MQVELFPSVIANNTVASARGDQEVFQCSWCGSLLCTVNRRKPVKSCPACQHETAHWMRQDMPVGPFRMSLLPPS